MAKVNTGRNDDESEKLTLEQKIIICSHIKGDVMALAKRLKIPEMKIEIICNSNRLEPPEDICMKLINEWEKLPGNKATLAQMVDTLKKMGRNDIISEIFQNYEKLSFKEKEIICSEIGQHCRRLGELLLKNKFEVSRMIKECKSQGSGNNELCQKIIEKWESVAGHNATKIKMIATLKLLPRGDIVSSLNSVHHQQPQVRRPMLTSDSKPTEVQQKIENAQRDMYKLIKLPLFPWINPRELPIEKHYTDPELKIIMKRNNEEEFIPLQINDFFQKLKLEKRSYRILIEGDAGFGKTTLLLKIASMWSGRDSRDKRFCIVFYFYLRNCGPATTLEDLIEKESANLFVDGKDGLACVRAFEEETLFLLDGYDELCDKAKPLFDKLLHGEQFKRSTVILTSRPGIFGSKTEASKSKGLKVEIEDFDWDKKIVILGISKKNRSKFLKTYFDEEIPNHTFERLSKWVSLDLFRCPLFLILSAELADEMCTLLVDSQTSLFKCNLNAVARRSLFRARMIHKAKDVELFDPHSSNYHLECAKQIEKFGKLSLSHLVENQLSFRKDEIEVCCGKNSIFLALGFINKHATFKNRRFDMFYEPIHKTLLEFFAAFYLFRLATNSEDSKNFKAEIVTLMETNQNPHRLQFVYSFLAGLLDDQSTVLFQVLQPWAAHYNAFKTPLWDVVAEIKNIRTVLPFIKPFLPRYFEIDSKVPFSNSNHLHFNQFSQLFEFFSNECDIDVINWDFYYPFHLSIKVKTLILNFTQCYRTLTTDVIPLRVQCTDLFCHFSNLNSSIWNSVVWFVSGIQVKTVCFHFYLNPILLPEVHKELTVGCWCHLEIREITVRYVKESDEPVMAQLDDLLKKKTVLRGLHVTTDKCEKIVNKAAVMDIISSSVLCLLDFGMRILCPSSSLPVVYFNTLSQQDKQWKYVLLNNFYAYESNDSKNETSRAFSIENVEVEHLDIQSDVCTVDLNFNVRSLVCQATFLKDFFLNNCSSLNGLRKLCLHLDSSNFDFRQLLRLRHLHLLSLRFSNKCFSYSLESGVENLASYIKCSQLDVLELDWFQEFSNFDGGEFQKQQEGTISMANTTLNLATLKIEKATEQRIKSASFPDDILSSVMKDQETNVIQTRKVETFIISLLENLRLQVAEVIDDFSKTKTLTEPILRELRIRNSILSLTLLSCCKQLLYEKTISKLVIMDEQEFVDLPTALVFPPGEQFMVSRQEPKVDPEKRTMIPFWKNEVLEKRHAWKIFPTMAIVLNETEQ